MTSIIKFLISIFCLILGGYFLYASPNQGYLYLVWSALCFLFCYLLFPRRKSYPRNVYYENESDNNQNNLGNTNRVSHSSHIPKGLNSKDFDDYLETHNTRKKLNRENSRQPYSYDDDDEDDDY